MKKIVIAAIFIASLARAAIYVSPDGSDTNPGTITQPLKTIPKAVIKAAGGDTKLVVRFASVGTKTLIARFANLEVV